MNLIEITEKVQDGRNLMYIQNSLSEIFDQAGCQVCSETIDKRSVLKIKCPEKYFEIIKAETADKVSEIIAIRYKYQYFRNNIPMTGLTSVEKEIMLASLIAADLPDDKQYTFNKIREYSSLAVDGVYNFRLKPLKKKWEDIISYIPDCFLNSQLREFVAFLLENKKKTVYIDGGKVYDSHFRRLKRSSLLDGDKLQILREVLLSNCGNVELNGKVPEEDEFYLKEFYDDKIIFSQNFME